MRACTRHDPDQQCRPTNSVKFKGVPVPQETNEKNRSVASILVTGDVSHDYNVYLPAAESGLQTK